MAITTTTTVTNAPVITLSEKSGRMLLDGSPTNYGDFRDELNENGFVVIKGAIPRERADKYADEFLSYIEGLYVLPNSEPCSPLAGALVRGN